MIGFYVICGSAYSMLGPLEGCLSNEVEWSVIHG
jgi:hypothetical protein